jgi:hypothetical protein
MATMQAFPQEIDTTLTATMTKDQDVGGWTVIVMPDSGTFFGTRQPVKVGGTIDGHPFEATLLPKGDGTHIIPIKAAVRKTIGKEAGAEVTIHLTTRNA